jgi:hypothetical protein
MMHVPLTFALLAALTAVAVLLRMRWPLLSGRWRTVLIALAFGALLIDAFMHVFKWEPNSELMYRLVDWIAVAAYLFLLALWTRMAPRWLTTLSAIVLVLPLLAPTLLNHLVDIFDDSPHPSAPLADSLLVMRTPWRAVFGGTSGVDLKFYYRPAWFPFVRHGIKFARLYDGQCHTSEVSVVLSADHTRAMVHCPPWPGQSTEQSYDLILPMR